MKFRRQYTAPTLTQRQKQGTDKNSFKISILDSSRGGASIKPNDPVSVCNPPGYEFGGLLTSGGKAQDLLCLVEWSEWA